MAAKAIFGDKDAEREVGEQRPIGIGHFPERRKPKKQDDWRGRANQEKCCLVSSVKAGECGPNAHEPGDRTGDEKLPGNVFGNLVQVNRLDTQTVFQLKQEGHACMLDVPENDR